MSSRYKNDQLRAGNTAQAIDLDTGFLGVNNKLDPSVLRTGHSFYQLNQQIIGPGTLADARNVRMSNGIIETRDGWRANIHYNQPWWTGVSGGDYEALGSGVFSDPDGMEWLMIAVIDNTGSGAVSKVIALRDDSTYRELSLDATLSFTSGSSVDIVQAFDSVVLFRGDGVGSDDEQTPLSWDGDWTDRTFREVAQTSSGSYDDPIPNAATGTVMANRLLCASGRDTVAVSDILDFTRWDSALNEFRINEGSDDRIVALVPWRRTNLVVLLEQSVAIIAGVSGDLTGATVANVNRALGCVGPRAWAYIGGDVAFLSQDGVYRVSEIFENSNQVEELPMSDPIRGYIERINPAAMHKAVAITDGTLIRWAVPIDGSADNNAVLTYDATTQAWQGYDSWTEASDDVPAFRIDRLYRIDYLPSSSATTGTAGTGGKVAIGVHLGSKPEVVAIDVPGAIGDDFLWTSGTTSSADDTTANGEILTEIQTRGYVWGDLGIKRCRFAKLAMETLDATWDVHAVTDGVNEEITLASNRTVSVTDYQVWGKADYVADNSNDDWDEPYRDDYTVDLDVNLGSNGVELDALQSRLDPHSVRATDRWVAFRLVNTTGKIKLKALEAEALMAGSGRAML